MDISLCMDMFKCLRYINRIRLLAIFFHEDFQDRNISFLPLPVFFKDITEHNFFYLKCEMQF